MKKIIPVLIIFSFLVFIALFLPRALVVKRIDCRNQYALCSPRVMDNLAVTQNLSFIQAKKKISEYLSKDYIIKSYAFRFKLPSTLSVDIIERKPKYALVSLEDSTIGLIDDEGVLILFSQSTNLPYLFVEELNYNVGERISDRLLFALEIFFNVYFSNQVRAGFFQNESLLIELAQGTKAIFPLEGDKKVLLGSLNVILNRLNVPGDNSKIKDINLKEKTIDLRFENPVIR